MRGLPLSPLLLISHSLLDSSQLLQLFRRQNRLDFRAPFLPNLQDLLLLLVHRERRIIPYSGDLFVFVIHNFGDLLFLIRRQLELVFYRPLPTLAGIRGTGARCSLVG